MSQNQPPWGPQGYPPQPAGGYPPGGYPQNPPQGVPPQGVPPQGYPQPGQPPGSFPPQGGYPQPGGYGPQPGYGYGPQPGPGGGYPPQGPGGGYPPAGGQRPKKSSAMIIGIVVAAVVLLAAVGGIIIALNRGGGDQPTSTITPGQPAPPTEDPSSGPSSSNEPPTTEPPSSQPSTTQSQAPQNPAGSAVSLGKGISLTPASGWKVSKTSDGAAQVSNGTELFQGIVGEVKTGTNPVQFCDSYHRALAQKATNGKFDDAKSIDLKSKKLKGASCLAQVTVSSGQGSSDILLYSVVSIRTDGVAVVGTLYFTKASDTKAVGDDFVSMVNSMLKGQNAG